MSVLVEARADLTALLAAAAAGGAVVHDHVPEALTGLDVVLQPSAPVLEPSHLAAGNYDVRLNVLVLVSGEDNAGVHRLLDEQLSALIPALDTSPVWELVPNTLTRITTYATSEWTSYGVGFDVTATYTL